MRRNLCSTSRTSFGFLRDMAADDPLPLPRETLVGCVWLPRIIAKARRLARGTLPQEYAARFCSGTGVDGQFLQHFGLSQADIVGAAGESDEALGAWFLARIPDCTEHIIRWNQIAINLGRPGYPMADILPKAKETTYRHVATDAMVTVFEVLEADERAADNGPGQNG